MSKTHRDRPRLGRGLSSLIPTSGPMIVELSESAAAEHVAPLPSVDTDSAVPPSKISEEAPTASVPSATPLLDQITSVPLTAIIPNPHQPRRQFAEASLLELAASLRSTGLIQPIIVRHSEQGYELIAGERRWRAAKLAGLESVPVIVRQVDPYAQAQMALVENIQREDLNPLDRAVAYRTLISQLGITQAELASRLGEDRSSIANHLRLLDLAAGVQKQIEAGLISLGHAKVLASVADQGEQQRLAALCVSQELSVRNLERIIAGGAVAPQKTSATASAHVNDLEKVIARQLGMRVQLRTAPGSKGRGRLVIHYNSLDQFDQLVERMGVTLE